MGISEAKYKEILRLYEEKHLRRLKEQEAKRNTLYTRIPQLKEIDDALSTLAVSKAKALITSDTETINSLNQKRKQLLDNKQDLMVEYGFPLDYLEPVYDCSDCKDTGYIESKRCHCFNAVLSRELYNQSNIQTILLKENFTSFTYKYYNETEKAEMERYVAEAKIFIRDFDTAFTNLLFFGNVGCGKTFLSNCIAKELLDSGHSVIYFTAYQLFDFLSKHTFGKNETLYDDFELNDIVDCDLLVLDDLGSEFSNSFTVSQFFMILNERLQRRKSTIISTNLNPQQIFDTYTERSLSRILGSYHIYSFSGRDLRSRIRQN